MGYNIRYKLDFEGEEEELVKVILEIIQRDKGTYHPLSIFLLTEGEDNEGGYEVCSVCHRWYFTCTCEKEIQIREEPEPTKQTPFSFFNEKGLVEYFVEISTRYPHIIRLYGWGEDHGDMFCLSFLGGKVAHKTLPKPEESDFMYACFN